MRERIKLNDKVTLDLPKLIDSRMLIQANSGGGKSWAVRRLLEQTHGKVQHIVIDPEGEFSTLREKYDYVLAAKNGDTPATPRSAALLARKLLELNVSAIVDLYELPHSERKRFVRLFFDAMVNAPKDLWHPVLVILDEAHKFAPEKEKSEALEAVTDMATRGRKRGFCLVPATQRLSKLNKDVAAECNNKLIGRVGLDVDVKRASEELGFTSKDQSMKLRQLEPGEFYGFGPAISTDVVKLKIGDVVTTHPKAGSRVLTKQTPPTSKIKQLLGKLADLPQEAEEEAKTMAELKSQLANTRRELTMALNGQKADPEAIKKAVDAAVRQKEVEYDKERSEFIRQTGNFIKVMEDIGRLIAPIIKDKKLLAQLTKQIVVRPQVEVKAPVRPVAEIRPAIRGIQPDMVVTDEVTDKPIRGGALRMLEVLVSRYPIELTRSQLGTFAKMKPRGGSFGTYLSTLKSAGLIEQNGDLLKATDAGLAHIGETPTPPQTPEEVIEMWQGNLSGGARRMFDVLVEEYPRLLSRDELGERAQVSPAGGSFGTYLSTLKSNGLVEIAHDGSISVHSNIFNA